VSDPANGSPRRHGRARRRDRREVARQRIGVATLVAVGLVVGAWFLASRPPGSPSAEPSGSMQPVAPVSDMVLLTVKADSPFAAIVGTGKGRPSVVVALPFNLLADLPGTGSGTVAASVRESSDFARAAVSNLLGAWIPHYAEMDMQMLSDVVEQQGGITLDLPRVVRVSDVMMGPGPTVFSGPEVEAYLQEATSGERNARWEQVLAVLFHEGFTLPNDAVSDDPIAVRESLRSAKRAAVIEFPSTLSQGGYRVANDETTQEMLASTFGVSGTLPVHVILLSGLDRPVLATAATVDLVPAGFRVVAYGEARGLHHQTTLVYAGSEESVPDARRIVEALGVGRVYTTKQQSGLADLRVVVGRDYLDSVRAGA